MQQTSTPYSKPKSKPDVVAEQKTDPLWIDQQASLRRQGGEGPHTPLHGDLIKASKAGVTSDLYSARPVRHGRCEASLVLVLCYLSVACLSDTLDNFNKGHPFSIFR